MSIRQIQIVSLPVSDQQAALRFFRDVVGFEVIRDNPMGPDQRWIEVGPPGAQTTLTLVTWFDDMPPGSMKGLVLVVDDIEVEVERLRGHGVQVTDPDDQPWGRFAMFSDPDGNGFVLHQLPDGLPA